jgi:hypothetical protein
MTDREDRALAALNVHFHTQLAAAADAHALHVDLEAQLKTVLAARNDVCRHTRRTAAPLQGCQFPADDKGKEVSLLATFNV